MLNVLPLIRGKYLSITQMKNKSLTKTKLIIMSSSVTVKICVNTRPRDRIKRCLTYLLIFANKAIEQHMYVNIEI